MPDIQPAAGGGFCGYNPSAVGPMGISTFISESCNYVWKLYFPIECNLCTYNISHIVIIIMFSYETMNLRVFLLAVMYYYSRSCI